MQHLTDADFQEKIKATPLLVLKFYADWCGPCQMMMPIFEEISGKMKGEGVAIEFAEMNIDESPTGASEAGVMSIPTIIVYRDGEEVDRQIGGTDAATLENFIRENLPK